MAWWQTLTELVSTVDAPRIKRPESFKERVRYILILHILDWLYGLLFVFTHFYFFAIAFLFFSARGGYYFLTTQLMEALSEPYLGALGVYVILKELRKRKIHPISQHYGEVFVVAWQTLLIVSFASVSLLERYHFDAIAQLIVTNSLAVLFIYVASKIHRP